MCDDVAPSVDLDTRDMRNETFLYNSIKSHRAYTVDSIFAVISAHEYLST